MTDTAAVDSKTIEHNQNEPQRQAEAEQQAPKPTALAEPMPEQGSPLKQRAEMVVVGSTGAAPVNLGQQIDFAQYMARASFAVPPHLRDNPGACLAVLDIATRAGLSPFMVANKTYVEGDRLAFESQLFHALLVQSGLLIGDLDVTYKGEGLERKCTVIGTLKSDRKPRSHTSPTLAKSHPGHTEKNGKKYVKGSPLWDDKPDVQQFYDTSRDWTRMFAPTATLGIYTPDEMIEHPIDGPSRYDGAIDGGPADSSLHQRLKGVNREEGHQPGHAESELASVAAGGTTKIKPAAKEIPVEKKPALEQIPTRTPRAERRKKRQAAAAPKPAENGQKPTEAAAAQEQLGGAEKSTIQQRAEREQANAPNGLPKTNAEYWPYAIKWIDAPVPDGIDAADHAPNLEERWERETHLRDDIAVPIARRKEIEKHLIARCKELRGQE